MIVAPQPNRGMEIRSINSTNNSFLLYHNTTERHVSIYWIDFEGLPIRYATIAPHASTKINTFESHPWHFRDKLTGEHLHIANNPIYWPQQIQMRNPRDPTQWLPVRKKVNIHFPMRTLRQDCLWSVIGSLVKQLQGRGKNFNELEKNIENLPVPEILKTDLNLLLLSVKDFHNNDR